MKKKLFLITLMVLMISVSIFSITVLAAGGDMQNITAKVGNVNLMSFEAGKTDYSVEVSSGADLNIDASSDFLDGTGTLAISCNGNSATSTNGSTFLSVRNITSPITATVEMSYQGNAEGSAPITKTYTINISLKSELKNINVTFNGVSQTLTPGFSPDIKSYTVNVPNTNGTIEVTANAAYGSVNVSPSRFSLAKAGDGQMVAINIDSQSYQVMVTRPEVLPTDNNLSSLRITHNGSHSSSYPNDRNISAPSSSLSYSVATDASSVALYPVTKDSQATYQIKYGSRNYQQGENIPLSSGRTEISVIVKAQNGSTKTYALTITKGNVSDNNRLSSLKVKYGSTYVDLCPEFSSSDTDYKVYIPNDYNSVTIYPTTDDRYSDLLVDGRRVSSGSSISISTSSTSSRGNSVEIEVTAQNGSRKNYTVVVYRAGSSSATDATLSDLTIRKDSSGSSTINYSPSFNKTTYSYSAQVSDSVRYIRVVPEAYRDGSVVFVNGKYLFTSSSNYSSAVSDSIRVYSKDKVTIKVLAPNYKNSQTYTISINDSSSGSSSSNNYLSSLSIKDYNTGSTVSFSPRFSRSTSSYTANVDSKVNKIAIKGITDDNYASLKIDGRTENSGSWSSYITLQNGNNNISVLVIAPNGDKKTYNLNIVRNGNIAKSREIKLYIGNKNAIVDNRTTVMDEAAFYYKFKGQSYTMVPLRFVAQSMDAKVDWDSVGKKVVISDGYKTIVMYVNGKADPAKGLDVPPIVRNGRTFVPLRYVSEQLNSTCDWDGKKGSIVITSQY